MLPGKNRLKNEKDFLVVKNKGKRYKSKNFLIQYLFKEGQKDCRFGIIVNKDISPHASLRNRTKRAIREGIRRNLYCLNGTCDCVVVAFPSIAQVYTADIITELTEALAACGLYK